MRSLDHEEVQLLTNLENSDVEFKLDIARLAYQDQIHLRRDECEFFSKTYEILKEYIEDIDRTHRQELTEKVSKLLVASLGR